MATLFLLGHLSAVIFIILAVVMYCLMKRGTVTALVVVLVIIKPITLL